MHKLFDIEDGWPTGVSNGLELACGDCGNKTNFDYTVTDEFWDKLIPPDKKRGVICIDCLDKRAKTAAELLCRHLLSIQYTAKGETIILKPDISFVYKSPIITT